MASTTAMTTMIAVIAMTKSIGGTGMIATTHCLEMTAMPGLALQCAHTWSVGQVQKWGDVLFMFSEMFVK